MWLVIFSLLSSSSLALEKPSIQVTCLEPDARSFSRKEFQVSCEVKNIGNDFAIITNASSSACSWARNPDSLKPIPPHSKSAVLQLSCRATSSGTFHNQLEVTIQSPGQKVKQIRATIDAKLRHSSQFKSSPEDCASIRLDENGGSLEKVARFQQFSGDCTFQTSAQLYDAWRFTHGDSHFEKQSSRIHSYIQFLKKAGKKNFQSGSYLKTILKFYEENPPCPVKIIRSSEGFDHRRQEKVFNHSEALDHFSASFSDSLKNDLQKLKPKDGLYEKVKKDLQTCSDNSGQPMKTIPGLKDLKKYIEDQNAVDVVAASTESTCPDSEKIKLTKAFRIHSNQEEIHLPYGEYGLSITPWQHRAVEKIKDWFSQKESQNIQPIGIEFCSQVLENGMKPKLMKVSKNANLDTCGGHATIIEGRRWNPETDRCELLIRNSWSDSLSTDRIASDFYSPENGNHVWIDQDTLARSIKGYVTLEEP